MSGIRQTVWLEPVPERAIENIRTTPDIDGGKLMVETTVNNPKANDRIEVKVLDDNKVIASGSALNHTSEIGRAHV